MPDIRYSPQLDDFFRAGGDENPVQPPWYTPSAPSNVEEMELESGSPGTLGSTSSNPNDPGMAYYQPLELTQVGVKSIEVWAVAAANANLHDSYQMGVVTPWSDGYIIHSANSVGDPDPLQLFRLDGGSGTQLAVDGTFGLIGADDIMLIRIDDDSVDVYWSGDGGANWTFALSSGDTTYRYQLHPMLGARGGAPGWKGIGGGHEPKRTQIYRYVSN